MVAVDSTELRQIRPSPADDSVVMYRKPARSWLSAGTARGSASPHQAMPIVTAGERPPPTTLVNAQGSCAVLEGRVALNCASIERRAVLVPDIGRRGAGCQAKP